jgi:hypothetical protein
MFCKNCGTQITEGTKFCTNCGQTVPVPEAARPQPVYAVQKTDVQEQKTQNNWPVLLMISVIAYSIPEVTNFITQSILKAELPYGIGYYYIGIQSLLYLASPILGICAFVKLKSIIVSSIRNTVIVLMVVEMIQRLYYFIDVLRFVLGL